ncbi:25S rRNA (cytosine2278-C5)-methyltransferase [Nematocida sp. LUAm3]|nr:25S rRNA (cytosine2278-C5)-methyltransferase [Nematocida sp. LUAm3]KAI5174591.1 25S rRNA (cytosine2278-C5)-methyltransferase [Nematocida sp. LUAm2]KAI5178003.1 25S rRNA (cytosine2278-C5)-methyltransferase [Nematocida sp. LUAm1]
METKKFYERCGRMLKDIVEKKTGIKTACYKTNAPTKYMAVLSSVLRRKAALERVVFIIKEEIRSKWMAMVICHEILYGTKRESLGFNKKMLQKVKEAYDSLGIVEPVKEKVKETAYIRLNTLKAEFSAISSLSVTETIIPNVYKVQERVNWSKLKSYQNGYFFVQDLSSCLPAYVLDPPLNATVIDTCSAPGNKTTHLSMLMQNTGKIFAVEKDFERFKILRDMISKAGAENIISMNEDFLLIDKHKDQEVLSATHILVDPSCSGSGLHPDEEKDYNRLNNLTIFQQKILEKALSYPKAQKVVYSTCSLYEEENESVVQKVLERNQKFKIEKILPQWKTRGSPGYSFSNDVVRCNADEETKGFFLACFVRK